MSWLQRLTDTEQPLRRLGLFRIVVAFMIWSQCAYFVLYKVRSEGFYRSPGRFALSFFDWYPHPPNVTVFVALHVVLALCGVAILVGWQTRAAIIVACAIDWYHLFLNQFWHSNNRYFLALVLLVLCFAPLDRALAFDARGGRKPDTGPVWTLWLLRVQLSLIYLASATGKLFDPDWASGLVMHRRFAGRIAGALRRGTPEAIIEYMDTSEFWLAASVAAIATELFVGIFLWFPRTRRLAIWVGIGFHLFIETTFPVGVFSFLSMGTYFLVVPPGARERVLHYDPAQPWDRRLARLLGHLDWLERLEIVESTGRVRIRDRDGRWYRGGTAWLIAASATPLLFVAAFPFAAFRLVGVGAEEPHSAGVRAGWAGLFLAFGAGGLLVGAPMWHLGSGTVGNTLWGAAILIACGLHVSLASRARAAA